MEFVVNDTIMTNFHAPMDKKNLLLLCKFKKTVVMKNRCKNRTDTFGLTSADFFLMPDRSLSYTDENNNRIFLNIPEQLLFRDSTTQQFTFTGLFFSDGPVYDNN